MTEWTYILGQIRGHCQVKGVSCFSGGVASLSVQWPRSAGSPSEKVHLGNNVPNPSPIPMQVKRGTHCAASGIVMRLIFLPSTIAVICRARLQVQETRKDRRDVWSGQDHRKYPSEGGATGGSGKLIRWDAMTGLSRCQPAAAPRATAQTRGRGAAAFPGVRSRPGQRRRASSGGSGKTLSDCEGPSWTWPAASNCASSGFSLCRCAGRSVASASPRLQRIPPTSRWKQGGSRVV